MAEPPMNDDDKRLAAEAAAAEVEDGMCVGLGTGSTAAHAIAAIARRARDGLRITAVATSDASTRQAEAAGIRVRPFEEVAAVDLTIDGADEIDAKLVAIKGAGGAMLREKVVAAASRRMLVVADGSKRVERVGTAKLPVELLPFAEAFVFERLRRLGGDPVIRTVKGTPYLTDNGNPIADCRFDTIDDPDELAAALARIPGVLGHGLFLDEVAAAYICDNGVVTKLERSDMRR